MELTPFKRYAAQPEDISFLDASHVAHVQAFHQSFPMYEKTPLVGLDHLAQKIGLHRFFVKDESYRFGLNAFKVLGGSFAIGSYIAKRLGMDIQDLPFSRMVSPEIKEKLGAFLRYCYRRQSWPGRCLDSQSIRPEGCCLYAQRKQRRTIAQYSG